MKIVNPPTLAPPRGFSHGIVTRGGRMLFLAGQTGSDPQGRIVAPDDLVAQFDLTLANLLAIVAAAGGRPDNVVKLNLFVRDRDGYVKLLKPLGEAYRRHFGEHYPTMALFEITGLFQNDALVEIEGIAVLDD